MMADEHKELKDKIITLNFNEREFKSIEDTFDVIKLGGSRLESKEDMLKLIILKETQLYSVLKSLGLEHDIL